MDYYVCCKGFKGVGILNRMIFHTPRRILHSIYNIYRSYLTVILPELTTILRDCRDYTFFNYGAVRHITKRSSLSHSYPLVVKLKTLIIYDSHQNYNIHVPML